MIGGRGKWKHYKQQSTYARLYKTFYTTILLERIGGGITILKRGVIITFGRVYFKVLYVSCLLLEVEASWSWTPQLTQHKYCASGIVYC